MKETGKENENTIQDDEIYLEIEKKIRKAHEQKEALKKLAIALQNKIDAKK